MQRLRKQTPADHSTGPKLLHDLPSLNDQELQDTTDKNPKIVNSEQSLGEIQRTETKPAEAPPKKLQARRRLVLRSYKEPGEVSPKKKQRLWSDSDSEGEEPIPTLRIISDSDSGTDGKITARPILIISDSDSDSDPDTDSDTDSDEPKQLCQPFAQKISVPNDWNWIEHKFNFPTIPLTQPEPKRKKLFARRRVRPTI